MWNSSAKSAAAPRPLNAPRTYYVVDYDTARRPFALWAFLPLGASLAPIKNALKVHGLEPELELNLREGDVLPKVACEIPPRPAVGAPGRSSERPSST